MLLNVCILPTESVAKQCIDISQTFNKEDVRFTLGSELFPHSTVFMAQFDDSRVNEVKAALETVLPKLRPVLLKHSGYYHTEGGYVEVSYQRTPELLQLHGLVIEVLKDLRENPGNPKVESYYGLYTHQQRKNAEETGYDLAYDLYRPHITLTRYKENLVPSTFPAFPKANLSFIIPKIALYKADENGAIYEEIITLELV